MLYVHPTTAIIGYAFVFISIIFIYWELRKSSSSKWTKPVLYLNWLFNIIGLGTGMLWAQLAWGSYWSWDPKENVTLVIFVMVCLSILFYEYKNKKLSLLMQIIAVVAIAVNIWITLGNYGLHSYGFY
jgi:cytochrome c biogenesis factor